jgi:hypothetical protein
VLLASLGFGVALNVLAAEDAQQADSNGGLLVHYETVSDRLTVSASGQRFTQVMARIEEVTGVRIVIYSVDVVDEEMRLEFEDVPLEAGLERLLKDKDYVIARTEEESRVETIWVLSKGDPSVTTRSQTEGPSPARQWPSIASGVPGLTEEQKADIVTKLRELEAITAEDPRELLEKLRMQFVPDLRSFHELTDEEIPDALIEMVLGHSAADSESE